MKNPSQITVAVGMSGGVDSSVAALLLKQQGYRVIGLFMKNWEADDTDSYCAASDDMADAQAVCDHLQIELERVRDRFQNLGHGGRGACPPFQGPARCGRLFGQEIIGQQIRRRDKLGERLCSALLDESVGC